MAHKFSNQMRQHTISTRRQVKCFNAYSGGWKAKVGDWISFIVSHQTGTVRAGRMLGVVDAPPDGSGEYAAPAVKGHILALAFSDDLSSLQVHWVAPEDVCTIGKPPAALMTFFLAPKLPYDVPTLGRLYDHGSLSESYVSKAPERVKEWVAKK